jgi:hypothetical protein
MRLLTHLATLSLIALSLAALAPTAAAVDLCWKYGICPPEAEDFVYECGADGIFVIVDYCEPQVWQCNITYMGGSPGGPLGNLRRQCYAMLA